MNRTVANTGGRRANSFFMLGGQILGKAGLLLSLMIYSRILEDPDFGRLALAVALGVLLLFLGDMGVSLLITRRLASGAGSRIVDEALALRMLLSVTGMVLILSLGTIQRYDQLQMKLLLLVSAGFVVDGFCETFYGRFRAMEKMVFEGISRASLGFFSVLIALVALKTGAGPVFAGAGYFFRTLPSLLFCVLAAVKTGYTPAPRFSPGELARLFKSALPLGLMGLFFAGAQRLDSTFVKALLGDEAVAAYQQCVRIHEPMVLLVAPTLLPGALFPDLCRAVQAGWEQVRTRITWMTEAFLVLAAVISIPLWFSARRFLEILWGGSYLRGLEPATVVSTFRLVLLLIPVTYVFHLFLAVYLAEERLKRVPLIVGGALVVQLAGLFLFTGRYGIEAAAALQCLSIGGMAAGLGLGCRKRHGRTGFLQGLWRPLLALMITSGIGYFVPDLPFRALLTTLIFACLWFLLGGKGIIRVPVSSQHRASGSD
jgi:O-antigen/teichoic acid export membrane protein